MGTNNGYDITLLEVEKPMIGYRPAYLLGPSFDDGEKLNDFWVRHVQKRVYKRGPKNKTDLREKQVRTDGLL